VIEVIKACLNVTNGITRAKRIDCVSRAGAFHRALLAGMPSDFFSDFFKSRFYR
jgi:hypothetical protein